MKAKEKADELVKKMYTVHSNSASLITLYFAKQCALIAVDEIIKAGKDVDEFADSYWLEVKQEIEQIGGDK
jgi:hypothetical protein